jgi:hypothetical protein
MEVSATAQQAAVHADRRRCTWMYETRNETVDVRGGMWMIKTCRCGSTGGVPSTRQAAQRSLPYQPSSRAYAASNPLVWSASGGATGLRPLVKG